MESVRFDLTDEEGSNLTEDTAQITFVILVLLISVVMIAPSDLVLEPVKQCLTPQDGSGGGNPIMMFVPFIVMFAIFYFLVIRPQRNAQKKREQMLDALKKGDDVVTSGGILGTVVGLKEDVVIVKIDDQVKVKVQKSAVTGVVPK